MKHERFVIVDVNDSGEHSLPAGVQSSQTFYLGGGKAMLRCHLMTEQLENLKSDETVEVMPHLMERASKIPTQSASRLSSSVSDLSADPNATVLDVVTQTLADAGIDFEP
jgi:hypothetical protein